MLGCASVLESGSFIAVDKEKEIFSSPGAATSSMKKILWIYILKTSGKCLLHYFFLIFDVFWLFSHNENGWTRYPYSHHSDNEERQKQVISFISVSELSMFVEVRMLT